MSTPSVAPAPGTRVAGATTPAGPRRHEDVFRRQLARLGWTFSAPALLMIAAVTIFPIIYAVVMSVSNVSVTGSAISLSGLTGSNSSIVVPPAQWRYALFFTVFSTVI